MEHICDIDLCTGCGACMNICSKNAISMTEQGTLGHIYPHVDQEKCIDCGLCAKTCPVNAPIELNSSIKAFAAISKDKADLMSSSSGAASSIIANHILSRGGTVYGCVQENYRDIAHRRIDKIEDVHKIKNSKYVQSNIGLIYREVKKDLTDGKEVLFTGTPCQIAGLRKYLRKDSPNLYLLDLVCHGVPSQKLLREDVERTLSKHAITADDIKILFRRKVGGKARLGMEYGLFPIDKEGKELPMPREDTAFLYNRYITAFISGVIFRENCFKCQYAQPKRCGDITIADFWGIKNTSIPTGNGISLLLANTDKGLSLVESIKAACYIEERTVTEAIHGNGQLMEASKEPKERKRFIAEYIIDSEKAYTKHIKEYRKAYRRKQQRIKLYLAITSCKPIHKVLRKLKHIIKK